jgi:hypothetical protein
VLRWNDGDAYLPPDFDVRTYIGNLETIVTHKEEIEKLRPYLGDELFVLSFAYCLFFWELGLLKASAFTKNPFKKMEIVDWQENEKICGILNTAFTPDELDNILSQEKPSSYVVAQLLKDKIAKSIEISISSEKTL